MMCSYNNKSATQHQQQHISIYLYIIQGRVDSYAFLELFFDDRNHMNGAWTNNNSTNNIAKGNAGGDTSTSSAISLKGSSSQQQQQQNNNTRDEDDDVGLSLDGDDGTGAIPGGDATPNHIPSSSNDRRSDTNNTNNVPPQPSTTPSSSSALPSITKSMSSDLTSEGGAGETTTTTTSHLTAENSGLKRAYDDAMAARGLMSVSRSSEKLTDLALPAKMRRTLSQEFMRQAAQAQVQQQQQMSQAQKNSLSKHAFPSFSSSLGTVGGGAGAGGNVGIKLEETTSSSSSSHQYPGQHPGQPPKTTQQTNNNNDITDTENFHLTATSGLNTNTGISPLSDPSNNHSSVEVPSSTKCAICGMINVDTQLRPCGHMFHGRCLKPSLQNAMGPPTCPIDHIPMQSAVLAIPVEDTACCPTVPVGGGVGGGGNATSYLQQQQQQTILGGDLTKPPNSTAPV